MADNATLASSTADRHVCAQVSAIIQTIVSGVAISDGFGKALSLLTASQVVSAEKVGHRSATGNAKADGPYVRRSMRHSCYTSSP